jgi:predicted tellurium resistance membrane protein TerC
MVDKLPIMIAAVIVSIIAMMVFAGSIGAFVQRHPTVKMLALAFLLLIGFTLVSEGLGLHIPKGYIYFAMAFSVMVEFLNMRIRSRGRPVELHNPYLPAEISPAENPVKD